MEIKVKTQPTHDQWLVIMSEYENSGLSQKAFCKQKGLDYDDFKNSRCRIAYHKKKLQPIKTAQYESNNFAEIKLQEENNKPLRLVHPNGIECLVPASLNDEVILNLIRGLRTC